MDEAAEAAAAEDLAATFAAHRPRLLGIAYRLLGSIWDAEDVVGDVMVRWMAVDRATVREPLAYLTTMVTRRALDVLRSARVHRERYVGQWLPEPLTTEAGTLGPLDTVERRDMVSLATLRMMEALSPPERAVLVLHEAFDLSHAEIAEILDISEAGARQHLRRARARLAGDGGRERPSTELADGYLERFLAALERGDLDDVRELLADDVVAYSDGGGKAGAAPRPVVGAHRVSRFFGSLSRHHGVSRIVRVEVNGGPAALLWMGPQRVLMSLDVRGGRIREVHSVTNPDKLRYLDAQLAGQR